ECVNERVQNRCQVAERGGDIANEESLGRRETDAVDKALAIVHDPYVKIDLGREASNRLSNVSASHKKRGHTRRRRQKREALLFSWPRLLRERRQVPSDRVARRAGCNMSDSFADTIEKVAVADW